jgi:NAD(P)-dependent dehydrogenase (short-subunit alcohol dehydrogenase family)
MSGSNQAALITGGAKRIGKAVALALAAQGYDIALHCNRSAEAANLVRHEVLAAGQQCSVFPADLADEGELFGLIQTVFEVFPRLSLLVNNASIFEPGSLLDTELDLFQRHMDVNLRAPFFLIRDFARFAEQGHIINLVDARILAVPTGYAAYSVSKAALHALTRMLALELAPGFRVNAIAPGLILPPPGQPESYLDRLAGKVPLKRSGSPENVVKAVSYLLGNEFVTGECLRLDGGEWLS